MLLSPVHTSLVIKQKTMLNGLERLIGDKIQEIRMDEDNLVFKVGRWDDDYYSFQVDGDCCSHSYFYDFIGIDKIIGKTVVGIKSVEMDNANEEDYELTQCYGYQIVVEDETFGELTAVFSFRNDSNGYYGGELETAKLDEEQIQKIEVISGDLFTTDK